MSIRIDAHHHVWDLTRRPQPWTEELPALRRSFGFDELAPELRRTEIAGTVVVHTVASLAETHELLALAEREELVRGVVGWFDLEALDLPDVLAAARCLPVVGIWSVPVTSCSQSRTRTGWTGRTSAVDSRNSPSTVSSMTSWSHPGSCRW
ncbi:hypothetical protein GCM10027614_81600 [Micromonospora vulcania]